MIQIGRQFSSPNFDERRDGKTPRYVVLHGTWTKTLHETLGFLTNVGGDNRVSAHYVIDANGDVYQLVDEARRAWHAGAGEWQGETDMNSASIGIEIQNYGLKSGEPDPYTDAQMASLIALLKEILARHAIPPENVIGHEDYAPGRKDDPGPHFPWERLIKEGLAKRAIPSL